MVVKNLVLDRCRFWCLFLFTKTYPRPCTQCRCRATSSRANALWSFAKWLCFVSELPKQSHFAKLRTASLKRKEVPW